MVVSDHSPCTPGLKRLETGDFLGAWGGISALQFGLPVMWTNLKERGYDLTDVVRLMSTGPARLTRLDDQKGRLAVGYDADLVVWDPDSRFTVSPGMIRHRHKLTPYAGLGLIGEVQGVWCGGQPVFDRSVEYAPAGNLLIPGR